MQADRISGGQDVVRDQGGRCEAHSEIRFFRYLEPSKRNPEDANITYCVACM